MFLASNCVQIHAGVMGADRGVNMGPYGSGPGFPLKAKTFWNVVLSLKFTHFLSTIQLCAKLTTYKFLKLYLGGSVANDN